MGAARQQQARIEAQLGDQFAATTPELRRWAVAMCSSRPFQMPSPPSTDAAGSEADAGADADADDATGATAAMLCAFVPFVDMANHEDSPNCEVQGRGVGAAGGYEVVGLVATRDLAAGEEATISYGSGMTNANLLAAYGFVPPQPNRHDRLRLPAELPPLSGAALKATLAVHRGRWSDSAELLEAALLSLPLHRAPPPPPTEEALAARAALDWLAQVAADDFVTPLDADLERCEGSEGGEGGDAAAGDAAAGEGRGEAAWSAPVLRYRVQRKRLWRVAEEVLRAHLAEQS